MTTVAMPIGSPSTVAAGRDQRAELADVMGRGLSCEMDGSARSVLPGEGEFELGGDPEQEVLAAERRDALYADGEPGLLVGEGQGDGRLAGDVEDGRERGVVELHALPARQGVGRLVVAQGAVRC